MKKKRVTYKKGYRRNIVRLLLTCGCLSKKGLHMLGEGKYIQYATKIKEMKEEEIIEEVNTQSQREGYHKVIRLKSIRPGTEKYMEEFPTYAGHYYRYAMNNAKQVSFQSAKGAQIKAYRESEVVELLYGTSVRIFPDEKIGVREKKEIPLYPPSFYNSLEVREGANVRMEAEGAGKKGEEVSGSRIIGLIISEGGYYGVYHTENKQIQWIKSSEGQMTNAIARFVNDRCTEVGEEERKALAVTKEEEEEEWKKKIKDRKNYPSLPVKKIPKLSEAILLGTNTEIFTKIFHNTSAGKLNLYESGYNRLYAVPYTHDGQKLVEIMTRKNWQEELKSIYLKEYDTDTRTSSVNCDGTKGEEKYVLLHCIPDMIKLKKFVNQASYAAEPQKYEIICFDFQEEYVRKIAGESATIKYASFNTYCEYKGV